MSYPTHGNEFHERMSWTMACRAATTANITISTGLNSGDTIDGVTLAAGDRVLVKDQSTGSQNGIYVVSASPARAADYDASGDIVGSVVVVSEGTANADTIWQCTTNAAITVGTTALVFAQFAGGIGGFATPAIVLGTAAAAGSAITAIRSDSTIVAFDATAPSTQAFGDSAVVGSAASATRRDHKHAMPSLGTGSTNAAAGDHTHAAGSGATITFGIPFGIDGGGGVITTGIKGDLEVPFTCTITGWTIMLDQSGSIVIDIWKDTYANYPPTVADTITASAKPTVTSATKGQNLAPSGWTTAVTAGDILRFNVDSITSATRATLVIRATRVI